MAASWSEPLHFLNLGLAVGMLIVVAVRRVLRRLEASRSSSGVDRRGRE